MKSETSPDNLFIENKTILSGQSIMYEARNNIFVGESVDDNTYNVNGVLYYHQEFSRKTELNISNLKTGIYILKIAQNNGKVFTKQIIKK
jgi:hypothetical protein